MQIKRSFIDVLLIPNSLHFFALALLGGISLMTSLAGLLDNSLATFQLPTFNLAQKSTFLLRSNENNQNEA